MRFEKRHDFFETLFPMEFQQRLNRRHDFVKSLYRLSRRRFICSSAMIKSWYQRDQKPNESKAGDSEAAWRFADFTTSSLPACLHRARLMTGRCPSVNPVSVHSHGLSCTSGRWVARLHVLSNDWRSGAERYQALDRLFGWCAPCKCSLRVLLERAP